MADIYDWSTTAADNDDADSTINWLELQAPSTVNNSARSMMKRVAEWRNDLTYPSAVGTDTITLTSALAALGNNRVVSFKAAADNTGAATLNVNSLGAKALRKISGGTDVALIAGDLLAAHRYTAVYDTTGNSSNGAWIIVEGRLGNIDAPNGSWTPGIAFGGASVGITYSAQQGSYTKVDNIWFCPFNCVLTNNGSSTGTATLTGLPVTVATATGGMKSSGNFTGLTGALSLDPQASTTTAQFKQSTSTGSAVITHANFTNTTQLSGMLIIKE